MPSYLQLGSEPEWAAEYQPEPLRLLCQRLRGFFQLDPAAVGSKGDNTHLYGYHRSRAWVLGSAWSVDGAEDYSVVAELDQGGDENWLAAVDLTLDVDTLIAVCRRLDAAVRAGACPQLREWFGTLDGTKVAGWDLLTGGPSTADTSHLSHLHMSLLRTRAGDDHTNLYRILTGTKQGDDPMFVAEAGTGADTTYWAGNGFYHRQLANRDIADNLLGALQLNGQPAQLLVYGGAPVEWVLSVIGPTPYPTTGSAGAGLPVLVAPESIAAIADATADELAADPERDGAGT